MKAVKTMMAAALLGMSTAAMAQATYLEANGDTTVFKKHASYRCASLSICAISAV